MAGIGAARRVVESAGRPCVLVPTAFDVGEYAHEALRGRSRRLPPQGRPAGGTRVAAGWTQAGIAAQLHAADPTVESPSPTSSPGSMRATPPRPVFAYGALVPPA
ncbi:hypothetical protein C3492_23725 [Streptomyces sp. Ru62]|uniref:hypothetical protein n=1 Tax=Streptomyces sp. Ru62 TaxID=2080745 RepID=UPI000CDE3955|nr:hypothetical protein [Streptomyces sp. Ru62]POX61097.1 hypothetical protein C3492_23725 [Streptomyces sp. Ru62]